MYSKKAIEGVLEKLKCGKITVEKALESLKHLSYESLSFANLDHHRSFRKGFPEAVYAPGKSLEQLEKIIGRLKGTKYPTIITRLEPNYFNKLKKKFPKLRYSREGRLAFLKWKLDEKVEGGISIITAGTGDIPVAEEAAVTLELIGCKVKRVYDCGVAGIHRLVDKIKEIRDTDAVICVAGMEGALPSVVAGLTDKPVIAVPTSVGYGTSLGGITPLFSMLNACSQGVAVVNIDNGYGAACFARAVLNKK